MQIHPFSRSPSSVGQRAVCLISAACLLTALLVPRPGRALDITSYVAATIAFTQASSYRVMMEGAGDEGKRREFEMKWQLARQRGTIWLVAGLACDAIALVLLGVSADRIERLDAEVAKGGGPITDAYSAALGVSKEEVLATVSDVMRAHPGVTDSKELEAEFIPRLMRHATISDETAARFLYGLYQERGRLGKGDTPWHDTMSRISGVPVEALAPSISAVIEARLEASRIPGVVLSARSILARDAAGTMYALFDRICDEHGEVIEAQIAAAMREPAYSVSN